MRNSVITIILVFLNTLYSIQLFSQGDNNQWIISTYLSNNSHSLIEFTSGSPDTSTVFSNCRFFLTNSSICSTSGELIFYTNGNIIYNKNHDTLFNGDGINPGWLTDYYLPGGMGIPQGTLFIPLPGSDSQYILFYVSGELCPVDTLIVSQPINLSYSIIDSSLDNGNGGIISGMKNIHAYDDTLIYGRLSAVKHANGRDWWVIAHKSNSDIYNILLVTPDTMVMHQQQIGRFHHFEQFTMQVAFSPLGDKYVIGLTENLTDSFPNIIDLLDFDRCTGIFSNERTVVIPDSVYVASGNSFSPNGRWLYVNTNNHIYQFDTWSPNVNNTRTIVATCDTVLNPNCKFFFQQMGPDDRIYVSNFVSADYLHYIESPDSQGVACNVIQNGLHLPVPNSFVMPNTTNITLGPIIGSLCDTLTSITENHPPANFNIFPNPVSTFIKIEIVIGEITDIDITLHDLQGRALKCLFNGKVNAGSNSFHFNVESLNSGIYLLHLESKDWQAEEKLIKL